MIGRIMVAMTVPVLASLLLESVARADTARDYWPAWRGPTASGVSPTGKPPLNWGETQDVKWKVPVPGQGTSSPVVWADKIFFLTAIETDRQGTPSPSQGPVAEANAPAPFHGGKRPKNVYKFDVVCLDRATGRILWKRARDKDTAWATPVVAEVGGRTQVIVSATKCIRSYDVQTGDLIWQCGGQTQNVIPSPIASGGLVFCTSGFRGSELQAIELRHTGDLTGTNAVRWQVGKATPYVPSPILYDGKLYVCSMNRAAISCYDAETGKLNFVEEHLDAVKDIYASPVGAAGRVYFVGRNGTTEVIRNADKLEILATNKLDDGFDASPAIAGSDLFLKGKKYLYCISKH